MKKKIIKTGFTLVEMLIVVGLITLLAAISFPIYKNFIEVSQIDNTTRDLQETLRRANGKSQASDFNSRWGVHITSKAFVLFSGSSWLSRDTSYDENHPAGWGINISSSVPDIIFTKNGTTTTIGTITINGGTGNNKIINVNGEGTIELQ